MAYENSIEINRSSFLFRLFLLSNGSLLIVNSQRADSGKYRCNATNQFVKKLSRSSFSILIVMSRSNDNYNRGLLPKLQSSTRKIRAGQKLVLHCASHMDKVRDLRQTNNQAQQSLIIFLCTDSMDIHTTYRQHPNQPNYFQQ